MDFPTIIYLLDSTVRLSTPLLLACLAGLFSERAGIFDIGLEGKMLAAAFASASPCACALCWRYTSLRFKEIKLPFADAFADAPILGPIYSDLISGHSILVYVALALVPVSAWLLYRTRFGLRLRAVGENPAAVDTAGVSVVGLRFAALCIFEMAALVCTRVMYAFWTFRGHGNSISKHGHWSIRAASAIHAGLALRDYCGDFGRLYWPRHSTSGWWHALYKRAVIKITF